ncbi:hypothetical protein [Streptomyces sp. NBC_01304]|uniref:hypothetical protein n=1 Tax=Streptomyces sp. NBC_01304 TaxID=2903818 RepID=UPI002E0FE99F|nr:hypothetical protein OG430_20220 [Streptomyces sp. NBC_01304]
MTRTLRTRVTTLCAAALLGGCAACSSGEGRESEDIGANGSNTEGTGIQGNGVSALTARQIADKAEDSLLRARSLHLTLRPQDPPGADIRTAHDLVLDRDGNCNGSSLIGGGTGKSWIVKRGEKVWFKFSDEFWRNEVPNGDALADLLQGRYVSGTTSSSLLRAHSKVCDLPRWQDDIAADAFKDQDLRKGARTTVGGLPAIALTRTGLTVYVATQGKPYPLKVVRKDSSGATTTTTLTDYDKPVPPQTPSANESVDVAELDALDPTP